MPGLSLGPWPLTKTTECACKKCSPIPGIFANNLRPLNVNLL